MVAEADLLYVLHWVWVNARLNRTPKPSGVVEEWAVERRRHALDWALRTELWDEITLDT